MTKVNKLAKLVSMPLFKRAKIFDENLAAVHMTRMTTCLNRPIYIGFTVLELAKVMMYNFHYDYIKAKYGDNATLLLTDTDSLFYEIESKDLYSDMKSDLHLFDTSTYPIDHELFSNTNKMKLGK